MKKNIIKLSKDEIIRYNFLKNELILKILKSIIQNQQIKPNVRMWALYKHQFKKTMISKQKNFCIITSRSNGVKKITRTSRHIINKFAQEGFLNNFKVHNEK